MTEEEFDELRPSAFAIAYRMLGSVSEAEDMVQECSSASTERARAASRWKPAAGPSLSPSMQSDSGPRAAGLRRPYAVFHPPQLDLERRDRHAAKVGPRGAQPVLGTARYLRPSWVRSST